MSILFNANGPAIYGGGGGYTLDPTRLDSGTPKFEKEKKAVVNQKKATKGDG